MSRIPNPLGDSSRESRKSPVSFDELPIYLMILPTILAAFINLLNSVKVPEAPGNRQIILDVPRTSRVDAQVTSGNNTVNLQNL
jgi:hypothetical protein